MDKPLSTIRLMAKSIVLTSAALYAVSALPFGGGADSLAQCLKSIWEAERHREDKAILLRSIEVNEDIMAGAIDGRLSLVDAAAAMREENESRPTHLQANIFPFRGMSKEESYLRQIIHRAEIGLADDSRREEVLNRLWQEFNTHFMVPILFTPPRSSTGCSP